MLLVGHGLRAKEPLSVCLAFHPNILGYHSLRPWLNHSCIRRDKFTVRWLHLYLLIVWQIVVGIEIRGRDVPWNLHLIVWKQVASINQLLLLLKLVHFEFSIVEPSDVVYFEHVFQKLWPERETSDISHEFCDCWDPWLSVGYSNLSHIIGQVEFYQDLETSLLLFLLLR